MTVQVIKKFHDSANGINRFVGDVFECSTERAKLLIDIFFVKEIDQQALSLTTPEDDATEWTG